MELTTTKNATEVDSGASPWPAMVSICAGMMISFLVITETIGTLTPVQRDLHASSAEVVWVGSIYTMVVACFVLTTATVGDILGRRRVFGVGIVLLAIGSLIEVLAHSTTLVLVGQVVMGFGGAMVLPNSLAMVTHLFSDPHQRTSAVGTWASVSGVGLAIGPLISGALLKVGSWHLVFLINIAMAAVAMAATSVYVPESRQSGRKLDPPGLLCGVLALGALIYGVIQGGNHGYGKAPILIAFCVAAVAAVAFIVVEGRSAAPMLHLNLFRNRSFSAAHAAVFMAQFAFVGLAFVESLFLEQGRNESLLSTGVRLLTLLGSYVLMSALASSVLKRLGFKVTIAGGCAFVGVASFLLLGQAGATSFWFSGLVLVLFGVGCGLVLPTATAAAVASVEPHRHGMASGSVNMIRQLGGALGASILGTVLTTGLVRDLSNDLVKRDVPLPTARAVSHTAVNGGSLASTPTHVVRVLASADPGAFAEATHPTFIISGVLAVVLTAVSVRFIHHRPTPHAGTHATV